MSSVYARWRNMATRLDRTLRYAHPARLTIVKRLFEIATVVDAILAAGAALFAAAITFVLCIVLSLPMGGVLYKMGMLTDEGAAWFGISFGIPVGAIFGILAAVYCF